MQKSKKVSKQANKQMRKTHTRTCGKSQKQNGKKYCIANLVFSTQKKTRLAPNKNSKHNKKYHQKRKANSSTNKAQISSQRANTAPKQTWPTGSCSQKQK